MCNDCHEHSRTNSTPRARSRISDILRVTRSRKTRDWAVYRWFEWRDKQKDIEREQERGRKIIRASGNSSSHSHVREASRGTVVWALATAVPPICRWVLLQSLSVSMGNTLKNHIVFSSFRGCVAEKVSNSKAASFMIYVTFDASLISNTNTSCTSTV